MHALIDTSRASSTHVLDLEARRGRGPGQGAGGLTCSVSGEELIEGLLCQFSRRELVALVERKQQSALLTIDVTLCKGLSRITKK